MNRGGLELTNSGERQRLPENRDVGEKRPRRCQPAQRSACALDDSKVALGGGGAVATVFGGGAAGEEAPTGGRRPWDHVRKTMDDE